MSFLKRDKSKTNLKLSLSSHHNHSTTSNSSSSAGRTSHESGGGFHDTFDEPNSAPLSPTNLGTDNSVFYDPKATNALPSQQQQQLHNPEHPSKLASQITETDTSNPSSTVPLSPVSSQDQLLNYTLNSSETNSNSSYQESRQQHNNNNQQQQQQHSKLSGEIHQYEHDHIEVDHDHYIREDNNYSPKSSVISLPQLNPSNANNLRENYRGFHANKRPKGIANVPPLAHPIKPRFKKKSGSLFNKLIYSSSRKESESSVPEDQQQQQQQSSHHYFLHHNQDDSKSHKSSTSSPASTRATSIASTDTPQMQSLAGAISSPSQRKSASSSSSTGSKHKFRIPSITLDHHYHHPGHPSTVSAQSLQMSFPSPTSSTKESMSTVEEQPRPRSAHSLEEASTVNSGSTILPTQIDLNLDEMHGIIKSPQDTSKIRNSLGDISSVLPSSSKKKSVTSTGTGSVDANAPTWQAPDSWDVKVEKNITPSPLPEAKDEDDEQEGEIDESSSLSSSLKQNEEQEDEQETRRYLPVLYGARHLGNIVNTEVDKNLTKGPSHIVRVFKEDNTFTTVLCPLETTTTELLSIVQRKFFLDSTANYQISVYVGSCVKVLEPFEKPLKIQMGLLLLSGYTEEDNLRTIGREDLSFVCKFVVENIYLRSLTHDEEASLSKNYVDVNISGLNLKNIPIIFHQHTYEIEKLNVADNPAIYIPLDFIQSCNNLISIDFSRNGCSKFPMNFLEAKRLTHLNMEKNFLDELPTKFSTLSNLTHLKLSSNQLSTLPKSFGKLKNLVSLKLASNYLHTYPEPISELTGLIDLDLSYNDLSFLPRSIGKLVNLQKLNLCSNKLRKSLPSYFCKLQNLKRLDIRYNEITNVDVLGLLPKLEVAYATKNVISGFNDQVESFRVIHFDRNPITELNFQHRMDTLNILDLSKAKITDIPTTFIDKIPNIEKLVLDKNHLVTLPQNLGDLSKLAFFSIYNNQLQSLPSTIGNLHSLQYLDLHSNNLQGLPDDIWNMKSLSVLNLASNILSSFPAPPFAVAKRISSSANLATMQLENAGTANNNRGSPSPNTNGKNTNKDTFSNLADSLLMLTLADNRLGGDCFESISYLSSLKSLNLSYNDLLEIPEGALRRLFRLNELYLSGNELSTLPAEDLQEIKSLKLLYVNNNKLVTLPAELSKLVNLQCFDVGSNQLKYNISNWPYDWNWAWNKNLKYLNFSGNKRFEIKPSHIKNPETGEDFDNLLVLKKLKVLGLIDVTLTTTAVPDQSIDIRIRTTTSEMENIGYGVSDSMGMRDHVSCRDLFIQKFRGNENEVLICSFDGKYGALNQGHRIATHIKNQFVGMFTNELLKIKSDDEIPSALRRTFLNLNKEINGILSAKKNKSFTPTSQMSKEAIDLSLVDDVNAGSACTVIYIKEKQLYTANIGDIQALLCRTNGDHVSLTTKHIPTSRKEFERIRASGGYVSGDGELDGDLVISRGAGFFNFLPHIHSGPDVTQLSLTTADDVIVMATKCLWEYVTFELAVDIIRQEKDDPMVAAQKLRDYAICYGASDKIAVVVVTLGERKKHNALYNNLGREADFLAQKRRRDRSQITTGDSTLRRLEDEIDPPVGELALVFTDIKNSTLLWDSYPAPMRSAIKTHNTIMRRQLRIVGGYEVKTEGDAFMVAFPSPTAALLWCFNVQQNLLTADWPKEILETDQCCEVTDGEGNIIFRGLSVRMGIHWGSPVCEQDVVTGRMDYFGPMVNRASRISAVADGGQIAVSLDFLDEMKGLYEIHREISTGDISFSDAYQGNDRAGQIIEREIGSIEDHGLHYFELGEKKLKGLETPELITLAYSSKLKLRFEIFQKRLNREIDKGHSTRVVGTLPVEIIYGLRTVSLRLENICSTINGGSIVNEDFEQNSSGMLSQKMQTSFKEVDLIALLNHIVTRIESCGSTLFLRQQISLATGSDGFIDMVNVDPLSKVLDELQEISKSFQQLTQKIN
ncbi:uncharacterized protein J8A68_006128 [[Candida] subhashii]|uniref:Adenylate cyclase n=1 Tax=[Candida] subhashii TaxID=561895 RepID=A0A8J5UIR1_9ASCO|nr:uncharacterized protein J8A68_006128 [[Candida] subhashii]KAG7660361.1 hypothetical protein J8A68_006128 [[Candida] subhashii]